MATILIVDDHGVHRSFLVALLDDQAHRLLEASDGLEALQLAAIEHPDLIITDIMMPRMDGYQFTRRLREDAALAGIPVIFYTSTYSTAQASAMAEQCGVTCVLQKPSPPQRIIDAVYRALGLPLPGAGAHAAAAPPGGRFDGINHALLTEYAAMPLARAIEDYQTVAVRLTALIDMGIEIATERDTSQLIEHGCRIARHVGVAKYAIAAIPAEDGRGYVHFSARGLAADVEQQLAAAPPPDGLFALARTQRRAQRLHGLGGDPGACGLPPCHPALDSLLVAPIATAEHHYGWIYLGNKLGASQFSVTDEEVLLAVATQIAVAYENLLLIERIEHSLARLQAEILERQRIGERLEASELQFRQLAENINEVFFLMDPAGAQMLYISPAYEKVWGRSCASLYASPGSWMEAIHPEDRARMARAEQARVDESRNGAEAFHYHYRLVQEGGAIRTIHVRGFPIKNEAGQVYRIAGIAEDITDYAQAMEKLAESERRYRDMLGNVELLALMIDRDARITYCNDYLLRLTGWDRCDLIGQYFHAILSAPGQGEEQLAALRRALADDAQAMHQQGAIVTREGHPLTINWSGSLLRAAHGGVIGLACIGEDISEALRLRVALQQREAALSHAQEISKLGHVVTDVDGAFISWSDNLPNLLGLEVTGVPPTTRHWLEIVHPADRERFRNCCIAAGNDGKRCQIDYRIRRADGGLIHVHQVLEPLPGSDRAAGKGCWFNTLQDVTEQTEQKNKLARISRIHAVQSSINSAIVRIHEPLRLLREAGRAAVVYGAFSMAWVGLVGEPDAEGRVIDWLDDPAASQTNRLMRENAAVGPSHPACRAARELRAVVCNDLGTEPSLGSVRDLLFEHGHHSCAALPLMVEGRAVAILVLFAAESGFFNQDELLALDELSADLSFGLNFIEKSERLHYLVYYDTLTGLPNRSLYLDRLEQTLQERGKSYGIACVVLLNIDRFGQINHVFGRNAGDAVLRMAGQRLLTGAPNTQSVARLGADLFAVTLGDLEDGAAAAGRVEQDLLDRLEAPFFHEDRKLIVTASAGIAVFPQDGGDGETLIKHAELALNKAKSSGSRVQYFSAQMNSANAARAELEDALRAALEERQFVVHYQPRVDLISGSIVSAEALVRWQHPRRGLVPPNHFIPLCEELGLIVPLGAWIIDAVCAQQALWRQQGIVIVPVAVNLSALQFKKGKLMQTIAKAKSVHGIEQKYLEFELTESMVMDDPERAILELQALKDLGAELSLDDFGTGYSSLAYVQKFPFDFVKIDRSFVTNIVNKPADAAIVTAVIAMAHSLGLSVVAEGVETEGQLRFLRRQRCDQLQGFLFSPAVAAEAFAAMLREEKRLALPGMFEERQETLLIVDDEMNNLSSLNRMLRRDGYRILLASSGQEGLDLLATNAVHVVISDQRMPGMSGTEFLGAVRRLYPDTIRIILSGYTDLEVVTRSVNEGAVFKFLTKPWDDQELREHIRDAFKLNTPGGSGPVAR